MSTRHRGDDRQTQSGAAGRPVAGRVAAGEPLEDALLQLAGHSGTVVVDAEPHRAWFAGDLREHCGARHRMDPGIGQQVGEDLVEALAITVDDHRLIGQVQSPLVLR